jgi:hypothetical protein
MKQRTCEDEGRTTVSPDRAQIVAELVADVAARARAVLTSALSLKRCSGGLAVLELSSGASETIAASALVALKVRFGLWQLAAASPIHLDVKSELLPRLARRRQQRARETVHAGEHDRQPNHLAEPKLVSLRKRRRREQCGADGSLYVLQRREIFGASPVMRVL